MTFKSAIICITRKTVWEYENWYLFERYLRLLDFFFYWTYIRSFIFLKGNNIVQTSLCCCSCWCSSFCGSWWSSWVITMKQQLLMSWSLCGKRSRDLITSDLLLLRRCLKSFTLLNLSSESRMWYQTDFGAPVAHLHWMYIVIKYVPKCTWPTQRVTEAEILWGRGFLGTVFFLPACTRDKLGICCTEWRK